MRKRKAFTLIELLVVIAIIAMLLAIVVPAMGKAKDYVKRVVDTNNIKQSVLGVNVYSQSHNGDMMLAYDIGGSATPADPKTMQPHNSYRVYSPNSLKPGGGMKPYHLAELYEDGIIDTPEAFYCPAQPRTAAHYVIPYYYDFYVGKGNASDYFNSSYVGNYAWGTVAPQDRRGGSSGLVRTSYNYWTYGEKKLQRISGYKPFIFDNIQDWRVVPHRKSRGFSANPQGLSAGFADGHVAFCTNPDIWEDNASGWPWNRVGTETRDPMDVGQGPGNYIDRFNEVLRRIQAN